MLNQDHPLYRDLFSNLQLKDGKRYSHYFAREPIPQDGDPRYRYDSGKRAGERVLYQINLLKDIERGYKEIVLRKNTKREHVLTVGLTKFTPACYFRNITRKFNSKHQKNWNLLQYDDESVVSFITFDLDYHGKKDESQFQRQIQTCLEIEKHYGFKGIWTTSPGDYYDGKLVQGRYWTIRIVPEFVFELREVFKSFVKHYGLNEFTWMYPRKNYRLPFQHRVHVCDPITGQYLYAEKTFNPKVAKAVFLKEANHWANTEVWDWTKHVKDWQVEETKVVPSLKKKRCATIEYIPVSSLSVTDERILHSFTEEETLNLKTAADCYTTAVDLRYHSTICRTYGWDINRVEEMVRTADNVWRTIRPTSTKTSNWHESQIIHLIETDKPRNESVEVEIDEHSLRTVLSDYLTEKEILDTLRLARLMKQYDGHIASTTLYGKGKLFPKRRWFALKKRLTSLGLLMESEYSVEKSECRKYSFSPKVEKQLNTIKERENAIRETIEVSESTTTMENTEEHAHISITCFGYEYDLGASTQQSKSNDAKEEETEKRVPEKTCMEAEKNRGQSDIKWYNSTEQLSSL